MLTASRVRACDAVELFRDLGYPIAPIAITPEEWRRAGVEIGWNGTSCFRLLARLERFDLFHLRGNADEESLQQFLRSYRSYNVITKSALIYERDNSFSVCDFGSYSPAKTRAVWLSTLQWNHGPAVQSGSRHSDDFRPAFPRRRAFLYLRADCLEPKFQARRSRSRSRIGDAAFLRTISLVGARGVRGDWR